MRFWLCVTLSLWACPMSSGEDGGTGGGVVTGGGTSGGGAIGGGSSGGGASAGGTSGGMVAGGASGGAQGGGTPIGQPVPGCVDAGDPSLTAQERTLLELPADSWYEAPSSHLLELCRASATFGDGVYLVSGCAALISSWSSGAYDAQRQRMVVWGGGHNDYGGNELYAFNLKTLTWEQWTRPSRPPFNKDPLDDGNPVSRHTYDGFEFISHRGTLFGWGGARSTDGNGTNLTWEYLPDAGWTNLAPASAPTSGSGLYDFGLAYDPRTRLVFVHLRAWFGFYDFATNRWQRLLDFGFPPYTGKYDTASSSTGAMHPGQGVFVSLGGGTNALAYSVDAGTVISLSGPWSNIGSNPSISRPAPGLDYDVAAGQLVAWSGGAPLALDTTVTPYAWVARSSTGAPAMQQGTGTFGRWRYVERYNVFVLVNDAAQNVFFYKHTPRCGR